MSMGDIIKSHRLRLGLSQQELGEKVGVNKAAVQKWENGSVKNIKRSTIKTLSELFEITPTELLGWSDTSPSSPTPLRIPVFGQIPAGIPMEAIEDIIGYEEAPAQWSTGSKEFFALKIHGDSMFPEYRDGDIVIFKRQDTCENGEDCAVLVNGNDATFKRVCKKEDGIVLQPLNPAHSPMLYTNDEIVNVPVRIIGVFWELRRGRK